ALREVDNESNPNLGGAGRGIVSSAPEGFTLSVPDSYSKIKMDAYRRGVLNSEIGRNAGKEGPTSGRRNSTEQVEARRIFRELNAEPVEAAPGGRGWAVDHIIELQHDLTGLKGTQPGDYQWQDSALNSREGSQSWSLQKDNPFGLPAGGVAKASTASRWYNTEGYRTGVRGVGTALTLYGAYQSGVNIGEAI